MKYLIQLESDKNGKFQYIIKSLLQKIGCFRIRIIELDEKFEDENQLTLFASDIKKRFTTNEVLILEKEWSNE